MTPYRFRQIRHRLNACILGSSGVMLMDDPTVYHGFLFGLFLMMVVWDTCDLLDKDDKEAT